MALDKKDAEIAELRDMLKQQGEQIAALLAAKPAAAPVREKHAPPAGLSEVPWTIRVRAIRTGMYPQPQPDGTPTVQHYRRLGRSETHPGDEFVIEKAEHFATGPHGWMELVSTPASVTAAVPAMPIKPRSQNPLQPPVQSQTSAPSSQSPLSFATT